MFGGRGYVKKGVKIVGDADKPPDGTAANNKPNSGNTGINSGSTNGTSNGGTSSNAIYHNGIYNNGIYNNGNLSLLINDMGLKFKF
jgi:hypothetical protein